MTLQDKRKIHFVAHDRVVCGCQGGRSPGGVPCSKMGFPLRTTKTFKFVTCGSCINVVQGPPGKPPQYVKPGGYDGHQMIHADGGEFA